MLVPVLAAASGSAEPLYLEIALTSGMPVDLHRIEGGHSYGACMNPPAALGRRNSLDAVAACFVIKTGYIRAFNLKLEA
jgi:hypothetical protein